MARLNSDVKRKDGAIMGMTTPESRTIVRCVRVNRARTPQEVLDATGRVQYTDQKIVPTMPRGEGDEVEMHFFKVGRPITNTDLQKELEARGLIDDEYAQAAVNEDEPTFGDTYPNGANWKDENDKWCFMSFGRSILDSRRVFVGQSQGGWGSEWWFGGRPK